MKSYIILFLTFVSINICAQNINVTGVVTSSQDGEAMIGVTVLVKGSTKGTVTNFDGRYELPEVASDATLVFSMIGYKSEEVKVNGKNRISVKMNEEVESLDEVVVVGYGTVKKSDLTSSITTVKGKEISSMAGGNAMMSLQGKANGVQVTGSGGPGSTPRVIIRGVTTVNGSDPLYVVDGMPVGTNINFLNQDDIESMEVLKDASAAAIYGTRGSNGVILITTKKGKSGKTTFQFSSSLGFQTLEKPEMAGAEEYESVFKARYTNDGSVPVWNSKDNITNAEGTDWWDEVVKGSAMMQSYNLSFQGGNDKIIFSGSLGYFRQDSHYDKGYWQKITARFNAEYNFSKYVKLGMDMSPKVETWDDTPSLLGAVMKMDPTTSVYRPEEEWTDNVYSNYARANNSQEWNPVASVARLNKSSDEYGMLMNPYLNIEPVKGLNIRTQFGVNARFRMSDEFQPSFYIDNLEKLEQSYVQRTQNTWIDWNWTNTINYSTTIAKKHNINLMGGYTLEKFAEYWISGSRENTPSNIDELQYVSAGTLNQKSSGTNAYSTLVSYLGRFMYNYDNRYYITASIRSDGSSKFPAGNKYATFPAVSAAWRISGEEFMKNQSLISNLKIRLGWGKVGNQNIDSSSYLTLVDSGDYVFGSNGDREIGTAVSSVGNTTLKWETVEDYNLGIDLSMFSNKLNITADLFNKKSHDMLLLKENLLILGYPMWNGQMWTNIGSMEAKGWEVSLNYNDSYNKFRYDIGVNLSSVKNKSVKLVGNSPIYTGGFNGDYIIKNEEGGEISRFYGYIADGLFQNQTEVNAYTSENGTLLQPNAQPGDIRFKDLNNDGVIDDKDKTYIGSAFPDLMAGLNIKLGYKNFDLVANFYGTFGNDIYNTTKSLYSGAGGSNIYKGTYSKVWHGEGTSNDLPRLSVNDANSNYKRVSSFFVEDGDYFRCKMLQIGYTLPKNVIRNTEVRLSLSAQNLFTITNYSGMDPEMAAMGSVTESGIDNYGYPNPRTFLFGININF